MRERRYRLPIAGLTLGVVAMTCCSVAAWPQPSHHPTRKSQPVPIARTAPDTTATIPDGKPADRKTPDGRAQNGQAANAATLPLTYPTKDFGEGLPTPFDLPAAPRARMRACGAKWQAIKLAGDAGSDTWRDFATTCLRKIDDTKTAP